MNVLVVGQAPSRDTDGHAPFTGRSGRRLAGLLGVDALHDHVLVLNLVERWPGKAGKGDAFPMAEARETAGAVLALPDEPEPWRLVLCGANVARAFGLRDVRPLDVVVVGAKELLMLPHPSGINRWWNGDGHEQAASAVLRSFAFGGLRAVA